MPIFSVTKPLHIIVACSENRVIGRHGKLPWHIPEDFKSFREQTAGKICVLGRVCFDTWPRATQDGRQPVVITSRPLAPPRSSEPPSNRERAQVDPSVPRTARSFPEALALADALPGDIHICGGQRIYEETLALAGRRPLRLLLTLVHARVDGDTYFPEWRHLPWREVARRESADANFRYTFFTLEL